MVQLRLNFAESLLNCQRASIFRERIKTLSQELSTFEQDLIDLDSLEKVENELVSDSILQEKDQLARAYICCCFADLLRLHAPNVPYSAQQITTVLSFIFGELGTISSQEEATQADLYYYVIESFATIQTVSIIFTLENLDTLMLEAFQTFINIISPHTQKQITLYIETILINLLNETTSCPYAIIKFMLEKFEPKFKNNHPDAYNVLVNVCTETHQKTSVYFYKYIQREVIKKDADCMDPDGTMIHLNPNNMENFHFITRCLDKSVPQVLLFFIPLLNEQLDRQNMSKDRLMTIETLCNIFATTPSYIEMYPSIWKALVINAGDENDTVRITLVDVIFHSILIKSRSSEEEYIAAKSLLNDTNTKVRLQAIKNFDTLDYDTCLNNVHEKLLMDVSNRMNDQMASVRLAAMNSIARLYTLAHDEIAKANNNKYEKILPYPPIIFGWIPERLLLQSNFFGAEEFLAFEKCILGYILPPNAVNITQWTDRYLDTCKNLQETGMNTLLTHALSKRKNKFLELLTILESLNENDSSRQVDKYTGLVSDISASIPGRLRDSCQAFLTQIADGILPTDMINQLKTCLSPWISMEEHEEIRADLATSLESLSIDIKNVKQIFEILLDRYSFNIINSSMIPVILKKLEDTIQENVVIDEEYDRFIRICVSTLIKIAENQVTTAKVHVDKFINLFENKFNQLPESVMGMLLYVISKIAKDYPKVIIMDEILVQNILHLVNYGTFHQVKFAVKIFGYVSPSHELVEDFAHALENSTNNYQALVILRAICSLTNSCPSDFDDGLTNTIWKFVRQTIIDQQCSEVFMHKEGIDYWKEFSNGNNLLALSLKVLTNITLYCTTSFTFSEKFQELFLLLTCILNMADEFGQCLPEDLYSVFRLQAAFSIFKFAQDEKSSELTFQNFYVFAWTIQDTSFNVRHQLISKINLWVLAEKPNWHRVASLLFLTIVDPSETSNIIAISTLQHVNTRIKWKEYPPDDYCILFSEFVSLLVHHPDFTTSTEDLQRFVSYINFFLDSMANKYTLSLFYDLSVQLKLYYDTLGEEYSQKNYFLSELLCYLIDKFAKARRWKLDDPGKYSLNSSFLNLLEKEEQEKVLSTTYIEEDLLTELFTTSRKVKKRKHELIQQQEDEDQEESSWKGQQ